MVRWYTKDEDRYGAWMALVAWYDGSVMTGKIAKGVRIKLWSLQLA
jgi:hypothetical protein